MTLCEKRPVHPIDHNDSPCHRHILCQFWILAEGVSGCRSCQEILLSSEEEVMGRPGVARYGV